RHEGVWPRRRSPPAPRRRGQALRPTLDAGGSLPGQPPPPGPREYLACERGTIELTASGERWRLGPGDVLAFRADQRHGYRNLDARTPAVAISVVCFAQPAAAQR